MRSKNKIYISMIDRSIDEYRLETLQMEMKGEAFGDGSKYDQTFIDDVDKVSIEHSNYVKICVDLDIDSISFKLGDYME